MSKNYSEILLEVARPDLYRINAFRAMELPIDATTRELTKRQQMVEMAIKTGMPIPPGPGRSLPLSDPIDPNKVREAVQRLRDPERRLIDELFWFWPRQPNECRNDAALQALTQNKVEPALKLWEALDESVSTHNLAVLAHVRALNFEEKLDKGTLSQEQAQKRADCWVRAFKYWRRLFNDDGFWELLTARIRELDDPRLTDETAVQMRTALPLTLLSINAQLAVRAAEKDNFAEAKRHRSLISHSGFEQGEIDEAIRRALGSTREMIRSLCQTAEAEAKVKPERANQVFRQLLEQTRSRLAVLDCLLPTGDPTRDSLHDDVAQQLLSIQITFGNQTSNWSEGLKLLKLIEPIAVGPQIRARLDENLKIVKSNLEYELCWFCQKRKGDKVSDIEVKMCGDVQRNPVYQYGRTVIQVEWTRRAISVPRCPICKQAHGGQDNFSLIGAGLGSLVGLGGCFIISSSSSDALCGGVIVLLICAGIGAGIGSMIGKSRIPTGIRPLSARDDFPAIKELKAKGWQFGEKPAGVQ